MELQEMGNVSRERVSKQTRMIIYDNFTYVYVYIYFTER